ncbi:hypothetical protein DFH08DRAFT_817044 [Mycena albidolilacea]|uniref:Uncharacterized protein n=1 Tax=Mycena albidolilacea TaxID=1033008 RepID=A0AAD6ZJE2_9AGAR|nr:hypothetical protein DFH08DRAFT_817044 [Mycena albidolilacea]
MAATTSAGVEGQKTGITATGTGVSVAILNFVPTETGSISRFPDTFHIRATDTAVDTAGSPGPISETFPVTLKQHNFRSDCDYWYYQSLVREIGSNPNRTELNAKFRFRVVGRAGSEEEWRKYGSLARQRHAEHAKQRRRRVEEPQQNTRNHQAPTGAHAHITKAPPPECQGPNFENASLVPTACTANLHYSNSSHQPTTGATSVHMIQHPPPGAPHACRGEEQDEVRDVGEGSRDVHMAFAILAIMEQKEIRACPKKLQRKKGKKKIKGSQMNRELTPPPFSNHSPTSSESSSAFILTPCPSSSGAGVAEGPPFLSGGRRILLRFTMFRRRLDSVAEVRVAESRCGQPITQATHPTVLNIVLDIPIHVIIYLNMLGTNLSVLASEGERERGRGREKGKEECTLIIVSRSSPSSLESPPLNESWSASHPDCSHYYTCSSRSGSCCAASLARRAPPYLLHSPSASRMSCRRGMKDGAGKCEWWGRDGKERRSRMGSNPVRYVHQSCAKKAAWRAGQEPASGKADVLGNAIWMCYVVLDCGGAHDPRAPCPPAAPRQSHAQEPDLLAAAVGVCIASEKALHGFVEEGGLAAIAPGFGVGFVDGQVAHPPPEMEEPPTETGSDLAPRWEGEGQVAVAI